LVACIDWRLSRDILGHEVKTARQMGWSTVKNGALLALAAKEFGVFVTVDRDLAFQQTLPAFDIAVIVLRARSNRPTCSRLCLNCFGPSSPPDGAPSLTLADKRLIAAAALMVQSAVDFDICLAGRRQNPRPLVAGVASPRLECVRTLSIVHTMRTNIVIDDKLMAEALRATGLKTKREAVELGLRTLLQLSKQSDIRRLRGKVSWEGDLDAMRRDK
jgi:Arc/MetJ family transcription regulator